MIDRLRSLYENGITIPVVNNIPQQALKDIRGSLRQGGAGSMEWFAFGIDPLLIFLERNLSGIPVSSLQVEGPANEGKSYPLPPLVEKFKVMAFCDDVKPAICNIEEFCVADQGAALFERAAGTKLHRDPSSNKCKFLPLGKWRGTLKQEDIPTPYMRLTDTLDMVGVQLCSTWTSSRRKNGEILQQRINQLSRTWKSGKFMPLSLRPFSANSFALSKVWFRCSTVNLRETDIATINSSLKKWLYADLLLKPEEDLLFRPTNCGGLGLMSVKLKASAFLVRTFLEMAVNSKYIQSQFLNSIYRVHILEEEISCPTLPPYYNTAFINMIKEAKNEGKDIISMSTRQWYYYFLDKNVLNVSGVDGQKEKVLCRIERKFPDYDWISTWETLRLPFIPSRIISFLWKLNHDLLTTEERVHTTLGNIPDVCRYGCIENPVANQVHCFFNCLLTHELGQWLLKTVRTFGPATESDVLRLNVQNNHALVWLIAGTLYYCWTKRVSRNVADPPGFKAHVEAELMLMMETRYSQLAEDIKGILRQSPFS